MKKPERMKNKTTKAFLYQNLYPVNLYVTTLDDWEDACDFGVCNNQNVLENR